MTGGRKLVAPPGIVSVLKALTIGELERFAKYDSTRFWANGEPVHGD